DQHRAERRRLHHRPVPRRPRRSGRHPDHAAADGHHPPVGRLRLAAARTAAGGDLVLAGGRGPESHPPPHPPRARGPRPPRPGVTKSSRGGTSRIVRCKGIADDGFNVVYDYANSNYTVTKAPLTVTADSKARQFGQANPPLTATLSGFVLGQDLGTSGVTGQA